MQHQACLRIDTQRKHQILLKESTKNNEEVGFHEVTDKQTKNIIIGKQKKKEAQTTQTDLCFVQGGKEIVLEVGRLAQQTEIDKVCKLKLTK